MLVDGDPLVGKGVDAGNLGGKSRIHQVAEGKPFALGQNLHSLWRSGEIKNRGCFFTLFAGIWQIIVKKLLEISKVTPKKPGRFCLVVLPTVYGRKRNSKTIGQRLLGKTDFSAKTLDTIGEIVPRGLPKSRLFHNGFSVHSVRKFHFTE